MFSVIHPQHQNFDIRKDTLHFGVPVSFFLGRYGMNVTFLFAENYFTRLRAPHKRLEFFQLPAAATSGRRPIFFTR